MPNAFCIGLNDPGLAASNQTFYLSAATSIPNAAIVVVVEDVSR
jgi:hypothetical protein